MWWLWLLPAGATLASVLVLTVGLRAVSRESQLLRRSLSSWDRVAVSIGDLAHAARATERDLRRLTRR
ncbi:MAG TPA: hypothetical protein VF183_06525 [Acidimicrobiales bacterium]